MLRWAAALALVSLACLGQAQRPLVREEIRVGQETWRLEWKSAPVEACGPANEDSYTCPCRGFAFGQAGELDLVRVRAGKVIERLALGQFFDEDGAPGFKGLAVVPLHEFLEKDFEGLVSEQARIMLTSEVARRPSVKVMKLGDYDHDGRSTEFYLQTRDEACGSIYGIVMGATILNPKLHAFGTIKNPNAPLLMRPHEWMALLESKGATRITHIGCGEHGADVEIERTISATAKGIAVVDRTYECTDDGKKGKFLREETF